MSIKQAAEAIIEAMDFPIDKVVVSRKLCTNQNKIFYSNI